MADPESTEGKSPLPSPKSPAVAQPSPVRSVYTPSFAQILEQHGVSLAVTTYEAGKVVLLRAKRRGAEIALNTHFRDFCRPMGFAWEPGRFAMGTRREIWEFHDMPAVAGKLDPSETGGPLDAAFLPRNCQFTGDIQVHEMVWRPIQSSGGELESGIPSELWFVNTRFSCLATRHDQYSFVPRWKPPFITALSPDDRCHLNGICLRDGEIRYVTALGESDTPAGWRDNKRSRGILMDVTSGQILSHGLSMPHSPRWHQDKIWILESGKGGVGVIDEKTGRYQEVCRLPGFTRGLDFVGPYALVGLSEVRESAVFSGIAIADLPQPQRACGIWAIDTRIGQIAGFVKFTHGVHEIFAVQALSGLRWPDILTEDDKRFAETYELPDGP